jgi:hypothetical protein
MAHHMVNCAIILMSNCSWHEVNLTEQIPQSITNDALCGLTPLLTPLP